MRWMTGCALVVALAAGSAVGATGLSEKPTAVRNGDTVAIAFSVAAPTDVEVAILDAKGAVVRHLAAGVVGAEQAAAPLQPKSLAQKLEWDGKDDFGKRAEGAPFAARVRTGMGVKFGGLVAGDPYTVGGISSIATDEEGNLYVLGGEGVLNQRQVTLRAFDAKGHYLREILPFPANLAPEAAKGVAEWDPKAQVFHPTNYQNLNPLFYKGGQDMRLVSASKTGGIVLTGGMDVYRMGLDGGSVTGPFPMWSAKAKLRNPNWNIPQLAVSADGRYIYYSNVAGTQYQPKTFADTDANWPQGRIYRQDSKATGADPAKFYDLELPDWNTAKYWLPDAWNKRTAAYGIAVDAKGHVYVCDLVNQAVVEVDADGKKVSVTPVAWPERVLVNATSGDYYVVSRLSGPKDGNAPKKLVKISGRGEAAKVAAEMPLRGQLGNAVALGTVDGKPVLWLAGGESLLCVSDAGAAFQTVETAFAPVKEAQLDWNRMAVDYEKDVVFVNDGASNLYRYDGLTGQGGRVKVNGALFYANDLSVGYDGLLYVRRGLGLALGSDFSGPFERFTRDFQPAPYPSGTHVLSKYIYSRYGIGYGERGIGVGPDGTTYISFMYDWVKYCTAGFGPDGKALKGKYLEGKVGGVQKGYPPELTSAVVGPITGSSAGIRVDLKGNIYIGMWVWPKGVEVPAAWAKDAAYLCSTGSIMKFTPAGGMVTSPTPEWSSDPVGSTPRTPGVPGIECRSAGRTPTTFYNAYVEGAVAAYPGIAPLSHSDFGGNSCCVCRAARFDLDRYGRLVWPNSITNSVRVVDNAGNTILEFGAYGNFDSQYVNPNTAAGRTGKPAVTVPAIPLAWPTGAGFSADHIYVNDTYSRRAVRTDVTYAGQETCAIK